MNNPKKITIKTGTVDEFMHRAKSLMRSADRGESIKPSCTLTFVDPREMLHFLSDNKINLINIIRDHPDSVENIAETTHRSRSAVYRDVCEMKKFGLVEIHEEDNPGHGRHEIVGLVANSLKLEAYL